MTLTKDITSGTSTTPIQSSSQGDDNKNLLDVSPNDIVFYVGGYPANFTVSKSEFKKKKKKTTAAIMRLLFFLPAVALMLFSACSSSSASRVPQIPHVRRLH